MPQALYADLQREAGDTGAGSDSILQGLQDLLQPPASGASEAGGAAGPAAAAAADAAAHEPRSSTGQ